MVKTEVIPHPAVPLFLVRGTTYRGQKMIATRAFQTRQEALEFAHSITNPSLQAPKANEVPTPELAAHHLTVVKQFSFNVPAVHTPVDKADDADIAECFGANTALRAKLTRLEAEYVTNPKRSTMMQIINTRNTLNRSK